jgi:hypothetical protein
MTIKKDENVIAGRAGPTITPVETDTSITNAKTGQTYANEKEAKADVDNPATATTSEDIQRDVAIKVNKLDIFGEVMK